MGIAIGIAIGVASIFVAWLIKVSFQALQPRFRRNVPYPAIKVVPHLAWWNDNDATISGNRILIDIFVVAWVTRLVDRPVYLVRASLRFGGWLTRQEATTSSFPVVDVANETDTKRTSPFTVSESLRSTPNPRIDGMVSARMRFNAVLDLRRAKTHDAIGRSRLAIQDSYGSRYQVTIPAIPWMATD